MEGVAAPPEAMRILLVSQMYPSPRAPAFGPFVAELERQLEARGHELARAVVDRPGGRSRHLALARDIVAAARSFRPDVVYAHFLVPAGLLAALGTRAPLVLTAHGQDVENARSSLAVRQATRLAVRRADSVVAVSSWLAERLLGAVPEAVGKTEVIDCGVDLERFAPADRDEARAALGWDRSGTIFLCAGSLTERKNVLALATAFERRGEGMLVFAGEGPLRRALEGRPGIELLGAVEHGRMPSLVAAADVVCQPSLVEPFGQATLEGMAGARSVVSTSIGGPAELVAPDAGVLVDPTDADGLVTALERAASLPRPNLLARAAAEPHDVRVQAGRIEALLDRARRRAAPA